MAFSVHVVVVAAGSAEHRCVTVAEPIPDELQRNENAVCVSGYRLKDEERMIPRIDEEDASMAAPEQSPGNFKILRSERPVLIIL